MTARLLVSISEPGADAERLDTLSRYLRQELAELPVEGVSEATGGEVPSGARAVDAAMVGTILLALGQSADGLKSVLDAIKSWLSRGNADRTVRLEMDGDTLELSAASDAERERLLQLFIARHGGGSDQWAGSAEH